MNVLIIDPHVRLCDEYQKKYLDAELSRVLRTYRPKNPSSAAPWPKPQLKLLEYRPEQ